MHPFTVYVLAQQQLQAVTSTALAKGRRAPPAQMVSFASMPLQHTTRPVSRISSRQLLLHIHSKPHQVQCSTRQLPTE